MDTPGCWLEMPVHRGKLQALGIIDPRERPCVLQITEPRGRTPRALWNADDAIRSPWCLTQSWGVSVVLLGVGFAWAQFFFAMLAFLYFRDGKVGSLFCCGGS